MYPAGELVVIDIKDQLWQGIALKEKDFRAFIKETDWSTYQHNHVAIYCSVDALIPTWAYMLLATALKPFAQSIVFGDINALESALFDQVIAKLNLADYQDKRVVVKGCSDKSVPTSAYVRISAELHSIAKAIMFGEPCSTVPIWKQPRK